MVELARDSERMLRLAGHVSLFGAAQIMTLVKYAAMPLTVDLPADSADRAVLVSKTAPLLPHPLQESLSLYGSRHHRPCDHLLSCRYMLGEWVADITLLSSETQNSLVQYRSPEMTLQ